MDIQGTKLATELLQGRPAIEAADPADFMRKAALVLPELTAPVDRALLGGALADRVAHAFASGYVAATRSLLGDRAPGARVCLAATEVGGAHPRAIKTTLTYDGDGARLDGRKGWVSLGLEASHLIVIARACGPAESASSGDPALDRPRLRALLLPIDRAGITLTAMPAPPFTPEITHAEVSFDGARVEPRDELPGDGYDHWLKPFRTIEDAHVHAALLGHLLAASVRNGLDSRRSARLLAAALAARACAELDPSAPSTHIALEGLIVETRELSLGMADVWNAAPEEVGARWARDQPLLDIAGRARKARFERAWVRVRETR